jgi:glycine/D-amino acid oxidase-like deaminating enzyme
MSEVGIPQDDSFNSDIAGYLNGALPMLFGAQNWGAESAVEPEHEEAESSWYPGRTKATWSGTIGWSVDGLPWVGRIPDKISGRASSHSPTFAGEWIVAGFSGEGMTSAWMCSRALGLMLLTGSKNTEFTWFPDQLRVTEKRWRRARPEQAFEYGLEH